MFIQVVTPLLNIIYNMTEQYTDVHVFKSAIKGIPALVVVNYHCPAQYFQNHEA